MKKLRTGFLADNKGRTIVWNIPDGADKPRPVFGPSIPQAIRNKGTVATIKEQARERFTKRLDHEVLRLLGAFQ
jgi:hypothetical protein